MSLSTTANLYYAYLSGVHPTLPLAELKALLEAHGVSYSIVLLLDQVAIFSSKDDPSIAARKAAYIHEIGVVVDIVDADYDNIIRAVSGKRLCMLLKEPFMVEAVRVKGYRPNISSKNLARMVGEAVASTCGFKVDLKRPATVLRILVTEGVAVLGVQLAVQDRKGFRERRQDRRPFFRSVALDPRLSRLFVNLSRPRPGTVYLDPFCGTGGFAVEAALEETYTLCSDIDESMVEGAKVNLDFYGLRHLVDVFQADAAHLPVRSNSVDSIATDPPYGRQAPVRGDSLQRLLKGFVGEASRTLKPGSYNVFAAPHWVRVEDLTLSSRLRIREKHYMRVHGSLTRILVVAVKES